MKHVAIAVLLSLFFHSCRKENAFDCFKSNGPEATEARSPGAFRSVEVSDKMEITITQGPEYRVEVIAGKNIIKNISSRVVDNVLFLENRNTCNFVRGYKKTIRVNITAPRLEKVTNYGVGPITFAENFRQDSLAIRNESSGDTYINGTYGLVETSSHGNGDIYLKGSSKILLVYSNGTNYTHAENFSVSDYIFISTYSVGDAHLNTAGLGHLAYYIWSDGDIYYKGEPRMIERLGGDPGRGELIKEN